MGDGHATQNSPLCSTLPCLVDNGDVEDGVQARHAAQEAYCDGQKAAGERKSQRVSPERPKAQGDCCCAPPTAGRPEQKVEANQLEQHAQDGAKGEQHENSPEKARRALGKGKRGGPHSRSSQSGVRPVARDAGMTDDDGAPSFSAPWVERRRQTCLPAQ